MRSIVTVCVLLLASSRPSLAWADEPPPQRTVSVHGHAERAVVPDVAEVTLGVEVDDADPAKASDAVAARSTAILTALAVAGVQVRDQRTTALTLGVIDAQPRGADHGRRTYRASDVLAVRVSPPTKAGAVVAAALAAGANRVDGVGFLVTPDAGLADGLRAEAVRDARRKADGMALAAGTSVGEVVSMRAVEGGFPRPGLMRAMASDAAPAVQPGVDDVSQDVDVVWTLR